MAPKKPAARSKSVAKAVTVKVQPKAAPVVSSKAAPKRSISVAKKPVVEKRVMRSTSAMKAQLLAFKAPETKKSVSPEKKKAPVVSPKKSTQVASKSRASVSV